MAGVAVLSAGTCLLLGSESSSPVRAQKAAAPKDGRRARSRFRAHRGAEVAVVACASSKEYLTCIDRLVGEDDSVVIIRGTTDGTPNKEDGNEKAGEERAERAAGAGSVRLFEGDIWDVQALNDLAAQAVGGAFTVVCMETSNLFGNDMQCDALALIRMLRSVLAPHVTTIVVRSRAMALHARCFHDSRSVLAMSPRQMQRLERDSHTHCQVLAAIGVSDYRDTTIRFAVRPGSSCLEIGCCVGTTTFLLADAAGDAGNVVGIDCGKLCIERARRQQNKLGGLSARIQFEVIDGWDMSALLRYFAYNFYDCMQSHRARRPCDFRYEIEHVLFKSCKSHILSVISQRREVKWST